MQCRQFDLPDPVDIRILLGVGHRRRVVWGIDRWDVGKIKKKTGKKNVEMAVVQIVGADATAEEDQGPVAKSRKPEGLSVSRLIFCHFERLCGAGSGAEVPDPYYKQPLGSSRHSSSQHLASRSSVFYQHHRPSLTILTSNMLMCSSRSPVCINYTTSLCRVFLLGASNSSLYVASNKAQQGSV